MNAPLIADRMLLSVARNLRQQMNAKNDVNARHSTQPWFASRIRVNGADTSIDGCDISGADGSNIAIALHCKHERTPAETTTNAEFIVRACNCHDALVGAVRAFLDYDCNDASDGVEMMLAYEDARTKAIDALAIVEAA